MRILFLSTSMGMGGADSQLLTAAQVMRGRGHDVLIVSLTPLGPMGVEANSLGIRTESLRMPRGVPDPEFSPGHRLWAREARSDFQRPRSERAVDFTAEWSLLA